MGRALSRRRLMIFSVLAPRTTAGRSLRLDYYTIFLPSASSFICAIEGQITNPAAGQTPLARPLRPLRGPGRVAVGASCCAPWSGACILRPLPCREAATTGAMSEGRTSVFNRRKGDYDAGKDSLPYLIRRRRRSTPQPLRGEPLTGGRVKASPCRGGGCEADGRVWNIPGNGHAAFCKPPQAAARPAPLGGEPLAGGRAKASPFRGGVCRKADGGGR